MSTELQKGLIGLRRSLLAMAAEAELRVNQAFDALLEGDVELARLVRANDDRVDRMDIDIESECLQILALQQPVASDLRFVLATLRIEASLERIADLARGIAKRVLKIADGRLVRPPPTLRSMCDAVRAMLADALRALADQDAELAQRVRRADETVDQYNRELFNWALNEIQGRVDEAPTIVNLLFVVRTIERIGDLTKAIAEDVVFAVEGDVVRHERP